MIKSVKSWQLLTMWSLIDFILINFGFMAVLHQPTLLLYIALYYPNPKNGLIQQADLIVLCEYDYWIL